MSILGETYVFVVNHRPRNAFEKDTVEKFSFDMKTNSLTHLKTYTGEFITL